MRKGKDETNVAAGKPRLEESGEGGMKSSHRIFSDRTSGSVGMNITGSGA
jgi:hypothetical protein